MYSRNTSGRQLQVPSHYSGNAFRPDGTYRAGESSLPVPVLRENGKTARNAEPDAPVSGDRTTDTGGCPHEKENCERKEEKDRQEEKNEREKDEKCDKKIDPPSGDKAGDQHFLQKILGGIGSDELLILALLFLLSEENGNEDTILLLALLLLAG